jgi:hypothetical protein
MTRSPRLQRFFGPAFRRQVLLTGLAVASLVATPAVSEAASISYLYTGSVTSTDPSLAALIPLGSPATILLTVDPEANNVQGDPFFPPNVGNYFFSAVLDFTGRQYILVGAFEINADVNNFPLPGLVELVELGASGPQLPGFTSLGGLPAPWCGFGMCRSDFGHTDPTSPALPLFPVVSFPLGFTTGDPMFSLVTISGSDPQVTPEPGTVILFGSGVAGIASRLRKRRARQRPATA